MVSTAAHKKNKQIKMCTVCMVSTSAHTQNI